MWVPDCAVVGAGGNSGSDHRISFSDPAAFLTSPTLPPFNARPHPAVREPFLPLAVLEHLKMSNTALER